MKKLFTVFAAAMLVAVALGGCITIYKDGEELPTDIYFASRQAEGKANQYYPILTFVFTNASGQTATKVLKLTTDNGVTLKNIVCGRLTKLGAVTFGPNDFQ